MLKFIQYRAGTFGGIVEYGAEKKVSKHSWLSAAVVVGMPTGVKLKIKLHRANQVYCFPIHLCEEIIPSAIFYATVVPLVVFVIIKKGIMEPFHKEEQAVKAEKQKQNNKVKLLEKRREARVAVELMAATYSRICHDEENKMGLVIIKALYGKIVTEASVNVDIINEDTIDVTVPIQCLVKNSKLTLHGQSKCELPGFYDPAVGEDKCLLIVYKYRNQPYEVIIEDNEILVLPKLAHRTNVT